MHYLTCYLYAISVKIVSILDMKTCKMADKYNNKKVNVLLQFAVQVPTQVLQTFILDLVRVSRIDVMIETFFSG